MVCMRVMVIVVSGAENHGSVAQVLSSAGLLEGAQIDTAAREIWYGIVSDAAATLAHILVAETGMVGWRLSWSEKRHDG